MGQAPEKTMEQVIRDDGRYAPAAYAFLHEGLNRAAKDVYGDAPATTQRHVTGQQICKALRELALERYGLLARTVLGKWNVRQTMDFGEMVYLLIEHGLMRKTAEDSLEDFREVYRFEDVFIPPTDFELKE